MSVENSSSSLSWSWSIQVNLHTLFSVQLSRESSRVLLLNWMQTRPIKLIKQPQLSSFMISSGSRNYKKKRVITTPPFPFQIEWKRKIYSHFFSLRCYLLCIISSWVFPFLFAFFSLLCNESRVDIVGETKRGEKKLPTRNSNNFELPRMSTKEAWTNFIFSNGTPKKTHNSDDEEKKSLLRNLFRLPLVRWDIKFQVFIQNWKCSSILARLLEIFRGPSKRLVNN